MLKNKLGRKRVLFGLHFHIVEKSDRNSNRDRTRRQELIQRPQRGAVYWLSYRNQDTPTPNLRVAIPTMGGPSPINH